MSIKIKVDESVFTSKTTLQSNLSKTMLQNNFCMIFTCKSIDKMNIYMLESFW